MSCLLEFLPRRTTPEVLSAILASLLSIFKHVMVPSVPNTSESNISATTWTLLSSTLVKCNSEIRRAVAEVWSSVLRRLKRNDRQRCIELMMSSARTLNDFIAWSLVFAAKVRWSSPILSWSALNVNSERRPDDPYIRSLVDFFVSRLLPRRFG